MITATTGYLSTAKAAASGQDTPTAKMPTPMLPTFPILTTERLTLRQPAEHDAPELFRLRSDAAVNQYLGRQPTATVEEAVLFIRKVNAGFASNANLYWAITHTATQQLVGTICLFDFSSDRKKGEIGYELLPQYQGQGLMHEAVQRVIAFAFQTLGFEQIDAVTHKANQGSTRLLQKVNFTELPADDEATPDLLVFRLSRQE